MDVLVVAIAALFGIATWALLVLCERLSGPGNGGRS